MQKSLSRSKQHSLADKSSPTAAQPTKRKHAEVTDDVLEVLGGNEVAVPLLADRHRLPGKVKEEPEKHEEQFGG